MAVVIKELLGANNLPFSNILTNVCKCGIIPMIVFGAYLHEPLGFEQICTFFYFSKEVIPMAKLSITGKATRSERLAVLVTPGIKADLLKIAAVNRESVNTVINEALLEYLENHQNEIERFNAFFGEE
jgi:hypothetical protein